MKEITEQEYFILMEDMKKQDKMHNSLKSKEIFNEDDNQLSL